MRAMPSEATPSPRRSDSITLRSGLFLLEYFDEPDGSVFVQVRGPHTPTTVFELGEPDGRHSVVARARGSTDDEARATIWKTLRAMGEFPWATREK